MGNGAMVARRQEMEFVLEGEETTESAEARGGGMARLLETWGISIVR